MSMKVALPTFKNFSMATIMDMGHSFGTPVVSFGNKIIIKLQQFVIDLNLNHIQNVSVVSFHNCITCNKKIECKKKSFLFLQDIALHLNLLLYKNKFWFHTIECIVLDGFLHRSFAHRSSVESPCPLWHAIFLGPT